MSEYFPEPQSSKVNVKAKLQQKNAIGDDALDFAKKTHLAN